MKLASPLFALLTASLLFLPTRSSAYEPPELLYQYLAEVDRIVDGNTFEADIDLGFGVWLRGTEIRLAGVKTPGMSAETVKEATAAFKFLQETIADQERVLLRTTWDPTGEYEGWMAYVFIWDEDDESWVPINPLIIQAGHGEPVEVPEI